MIALRGGEFEYPTIKTDLGGEDSVDCVNPNLNFMSNVSAKLGINPKGFSNFKDGLDKKNQVHHDAKMDDSCEDAKERPIDFIDGKTWVRTSTSVSIVPEGGNVDNLYFIRSASSTK